MNRSACIPQYHEAMSSNPLSWRVMTELTGYEVDVDETIEVGRCRRCRAPVTRVVWRK